MLKLLRNCISTLKIIQYEGKNIEWYFLEELEKFQRELGFKFANKIDGQHIFFQNLKMKVKLAAQLLSSKVADALEFLMESGHPKFQGAEATIKFIRVTDRLFDLLNSRNVCGKGYKMPLRRETKDVWMNVIQDTETYLLKLEYAGRPLVKHRKGFFITGFIFCLHSCSQLAQELLFDLPNPLDYILMYKTSQDHEEIYFGQLRQGCGANTNPDLFKIKHRLKRQF